MPKEGNLQGQRSSREKYSFGASFLLFCWYLFNKSPKEWLSAQPQSSRRWWLVCRSVCGGCVCAVCCSWSFCSSSECCRVLRLSLLSTYIIDGEIAGRVAQSCLSCHFCLNLTWQLDRSCFHCLKWGGGEMGGGFLKKTIYTYFSACRRLVFGVVWARKHLIMQPISDL